MKTSDSHWHKQLSQESLRDGPYWMWPFENYKTFCPYLVGDYGQVAEQIVLYMEAGYRTFILDIPPSRDELGHIKTMFQQAGATTA